MKGKTMVKKKKIKGKTKIKKIQLNLASPLYILV
jgi:hypothetical protein